MKITGQKVWPPSLSNLRGWVITLSYGLRYHKTCIPFTQDETVSCKMHLIINNLSCCNHGSAMQHFKPSSCWYEWVLWDITQIMLLTATRKRTTWLLWLIEVGRWIFALTIFLNQLHANSFILFYSSIFWWCTPEWRFSIGNWKRLFLFIPLYSAVQYF